MNIVLLILATLCLIIGHYFKVLRQHKLIEIYEFPDDQNLLRGLSVGYIINFILPFKLGDLFRAWICGRKMKNGFTFSLATIIIDRILDVIFVGFIFLLMFLLKINSNLILENVLFYTLSSLLLIFMMIFLLNHNKFIKKAVRKISKIFNQNIELGILKACWCIISSFKDIFKNISKKTLLINTITIWLFYLGSYFLFALSMENFGYDVSVPSMVIDLFSKNSLNASTLNITKILEGYSLYFMIYITIPLLILFIISILPLPSKLKRKQQSDRRYLELLPHVNAHDKLIFLEAYFNAESRQFFQNYLKINRDICILEDYSAGSNATTMLCTDNNKTFFRKYSFGKDSEKLYEQIKWLKNYNKLIPLPEVLNVKKGNDYCSYDMPYNSSAIGFFNYVHSYPTSESFVTLKKVLTDLEKKLYKKNQKKCNYELLEKYIDSKVVKNLEKIESSNYIKSVLKYDYIIINGVKYHNLNYCKKYLNKEYLLKVFENDECSVIHGDLTIENIIYNKDSYYIIDPNTGNLHESPNLDYAKLLQSLHGNYEFLMKTKTVEVHKDNINFLFTPSLNYKEIYEAYHKHLETTFSYEKVKSIYFHEIIHWLRLMPYKIEKNKERCLLFYAGMIIVMNDIIKRYGGK